MTKTLAACAVAIVASVASIVLAQAGVHGTVVLKNGQRYAGHYIVYRYDRAQLTMRADDGSEPRIPADQIAYVEFTPPAREVSPADLGSLTTSQLLVRRDGSTAPGHLEELGHQRPSDESTKYLVIFKPQNGSQQRLDVSDVSRVYLAAPAAVATRGAQPPVAQPPVAQPPVAQPPVATRGPFGRNRTAGLTLPANQQWTATNLRVNAGDWYDFNITGEIRYTPDPNARAARQGSIPQQRRLGAPLPNELAGAVIARIDNGQPFLIGGQPSVRMPASGMLWLGINDDNVSDNSGSFQVSVNRRQ
jgi:hypothetical protein